MHLRIRHRRLGDHHHARIFIGPDADHLALAGTLALRATPVDELEPFCRVFEVAGVDESEDALTYDEVDEDQTNPDVPSNDAAPARPFAIRRNTIAHYRGLVGLKQRELAARVGIAQPDLSLIEAGYAVPTDEILERIASQLATPAEMLYAADD